MENFTNNKEHSRLMSSALTDTEFRELLINDPTNALKRGYIGQAFRLTPEEEEMVISIRTTSLTDFARQLLERNAGSSSGFIIED